jgi:hypothetical protein
MTNTSQACATLIKFHNIQKKDNVSKVQKSFNISQMFQIGSSN